MLQTAMTEMFGIKYPIMLAGMNWITDPKLVAAVSNAGGLGNLALAQFDPETARENIRQVKALTDKPFMINQPLNWDNAKDNIGVAIAEEVNCINYSLGKPWFVEKVHQYDGKVVGTVAVGKHAVKAVELGCDAIIVTGYEAAAHGAAAASLVLIPLVTRMVKIPVIAAGGFYDGRGLAAALALGASGISMGTRFILVQESRVHERFKQLCLTATEQDTLYSDVFDGLLGRVLKTKKAESLMREGESFGLIRALPNALRIKKMLNQSWGEFAGNAFKMMNAEEGHNLFELAYMASGAIRQLKAIEEGDVDEGVMFCGQAVGDIHDIPTVKEIIERVTSEAESVIKEMNKSFVE
jgi:enoyl-[acyl-carrier protein] reductase II